MVKLEQKNNILRAKIESYESNQTDWESFKREFNHDMEELGMAFKDLTSDNEITKISRLINNINYIPPD
ncbi:MAG: hypothetical protein IPF54_14015 [Draconibacterium sp.]|nr:hypothetical protein [Draconibacterium sp.]